MRKEPVEQESKTGSLVISVMFVIAGVITLYDAAGYSDVDSKVFPRAAAIILIVAASLSIVITLFGHSDNEGFGRGSWWRRCCLISALLIACFLMPNAGFLVASAVAFAGCLVAANHDSWRLANVLIYATSGLAVVGGFHSLFKFGLSVPLP